jgi:hypothetical protein
MPDFRGSLLFSQPAQVAGWSEIYYLNDPNHNGALRTMLELMQRRMAISNGTTYCDSVRVSNVDHPRDVLFVNFANPIQGKYRKANGSDVGWTAVMVNLRVDPANRGKKFLRGMPDELINVPFSGQEIFTAPGDWNFAFNAYREYIITHNFELRRTKKNPNPPPPARVFKDFVGPIQELEYVRVVSRRIGRPFGLQRGRRPKKK